MRRHTKDVLERNKDMAYIPKNKPLPIEHGIEPCPKYEKIWIGRNSAANVSVFYGHKVGNDDVEYIRRDIVKVLTEAEGDNGYGKGMRYAVETVEEALLSEVLPLFMHGGEADEVIAKLEESLLKKGISV